MPEPTNAKIIVFDLDGTLGYFSQVSVVWEFLRRKTNFVKKGKEEKEKEKENEVSLFNSVFDLFPEIIRPNMFEILKYVYKQKRENCCDKIMIYTNNKKQKVWAEQIAQHFEERVFETSHSVAQPLFDQIIHAFKVNGVVVEFSRTTNKKTHGDFLSCTRMPDNTQICFLDDCIHENMCNSNVYYIHFEPYVYHLPFSTMFARLQTAEDIHIQHALSSFQNESDFLYSVNHFTKRIPFDYIKKKFGDYEMDKIVSNNILEKLKSFFRVCEDGNCGRFIKVLPNSMFSKKNRKKEKKNGNKTKRRKK